ncbi:hypothetical protein EC968_008272 [Mortierella alpina]|nr:hypothetical protein EC968_008272 [Mortierella alpina]
MSSSTTTTLAQRDSSAPGPTSTRPAPATTPPPTTTVAPPPTTHTPPPPPPSSAPPPVSTARSSAPPVVVIPTPSAVPSAAPTSTLNIPCMSSAQCGENQLCAYQTKGAITGYCQAMVGSLCRSNPVIPCQSNAQCNDPAYSYCAAPNEKEPLNKICTGLGMPGTDTQCGGNGTSGGSNNGGGGSNSSLTNTLKYAGIAVGSVALLGIIFALVRWQRNKRRSTIPDFSEIDYGMSNRHRSSVGAAAVVSGSGGAGAGGAEQSYPFSNRPNAGTAAGTNDQDGFYDDQYYDDQYAQNMHPMAGMAAGGINNKIQTSQDQYYDQYATNNHYDPQQQQAYDEQYYKEAAAYGGYDQHGNYVGDGTYYDNNAAYGDYGTQQQQQQYGAAQVVPSSGAEYAVTSPTSPLDAHLRANAGAVNQYGVEPSELDFGGTTQPPSSQQHGGGYGQRY